MVMVGMLVVGNMVVVFTILVEWNVLKISSLDAMKLIFFMFATIVETFSPIINVATLALGSRPRQGVAKLRAKKEARESCRMFLGVQESVRE